MAAFLNKPSDFSRPIVKNVDPLQLMPPCAFETRKPVEPDKARDVAALQDVVNAREEISKLKQEIELLKNERTKSALPLPCQEPQPPKVHILQQAASKEETKYADELISRQAREVEELKSQIRALHQEHREQMSEMEKEKELEERDASHRISGLELALREHEDRYDQQVDRLSHQHQKELDDVNLALDNTTRELSQTKSEYVARLRGLETEIESLRSDSAATITQLEGEIRSKSLQVENQAQQISQLKTYIGENEKNYQPPQVWRTEKETLNNRLKVCEAEKENLQSNMELLNVRLKSISEILSVQETEIAKGKTERLSNNKQEGLLLSRWRDKVFSLLVQQQSVSIVQRKDEQNWKEKVRDLEDKLRSSESEREVLSHSLAEKSAQLQMEQNNAKRYQEEITQAQQVALCLDDQLVQNRSSAECLGQFAESVGGQFEENMKILHTAMSTLKTYGQRISFASSRVDMLQGQFARKEALLRLQAGEQETEYVEEHESIKGADTDRLSEELEKVMAERDLLAAQIQQDAGLLANKLHQNKAQYEGEITSLKQTVEDLELLVQEKTQTCVSLSEKLDQTQAELEDVSQRTDMLRTELSKQEFATQSAMEDQRRVDREEFSQQLADMDRKLNEARREHTKAVVSLRQLERQSGREKERVREETALAEEHYRRQISGLQEQLTAVEKERNIMMATLRQEGLMTKVRSERGEPVTLQSEEVEAPSLPPQPRESAEPISAVLKDLKSLTAAVLEEGEEESDEEDEEH